MPSRKPTPDIMGDLLSSQIASIPVQQQAVTPEYQNTIKPVNHNTVEPVDQQASEPASQKIKVTYYVEEAAADALETMWAELRRLAGRKKGTSISRSLIVEQMLLSALDDLNDQKRGSWVARLVLGQEDRK